VELTHAVSAAIGAQRVGLQISPGNPYNDIVETNRDEVYLTLIEAIDDLRLAYLSVSEGRDRPPPTAEGTTATSTIRRYSCWRSASSSASSRSRFCSLMSAASKALTSRCNQIFRNASRSWSACSEA
jgi:2,4-dienoyl-CoA reductase-like NADH-dependent reductase (Old Yellow Enzyme family)